MSRLAKIRQWINWLTVLIVMLAVATIVTVAMGRTDVSRVLSLINFCVGFVWGVCVWLWLHTLKAMSERSLEQTLAEEVDDDEIEVDLSNYDPHKCGACGQEVGDLTEHWRKTHRSSELHG